VRERIERNLPAMKRGKISTEFRGECMRRLVTRGGEQENDIPGEAHRQEFGRDHNGFQTGRDTTHSVTLVVVVHKLCGARQVP
jgi:hypothetical protein